MAPADPRSGPAEPVRQPVGAPHPRFTEGVIGEAHDFMIREEALVAGDREGSG